MRDEGATRQLDPQARALLARIQAANPIPYAQLGPVAARDLYRISRASLAPAAPEVALVEDLVVPGPGGTVRVRHYRPHGSTESETLPALVFFHGGGHTIGDLETHDVACRSLANAARSAVFAVDYRLAPEHRFPAAVEDAIAATRWVAASCDALRIDGARIAVGGDSAGGNLAAVVALALRDAGGPPLALQVLVYPAVDLRAEHPSHFAYGDGHLLTRESILWFRSQYLADPGQANDWRASPLLAADLSGLPPAYVVTAGFDPLVDEGEAYAERLASSGVRVTYECFTGMIHGFLLMGGVLAAANHAIQRAALLMRIAFVTARSPLGGAQTLPIETAGDPEARRSAER
jgi:acetyl esterase